MPADTGITALVLVIVAILPLQSVDNDKPHAVNI
jgi:hypothetical protein